VVEADIDEEALVIRFSPWTAERVLHRAGLAQRRRGQWTASVFAAAKIVGESDDDVFRRLLAASDLHGLGSNDKFAICARAGDLLVRGFVFLNLDPPPRFLAGSDGVC